LAKELGLPQKKVFAQTLFWQVSTQRYPPFLTRGFALSKRVLSTRVVNWPRNFPDREKEGFCSF